MSIESKIESIQDCFRETCEFTHEDLMPSVSIYSNSGRWYAAMELSMLEGEVSHLVSGLVGSGRTVIEALDSLYGDVQSLSSDEIDEMCDAAMTAIGGYDYE